jgi:chitinase
LFGGAAQASAAKPKVSIKDAAVTEPQEEGDTVEAVFRVTLSKKSDDVVKVTYDTGSGTAGPGDYDPESGRVKIKAGEKSTKIKITVNGDEDVEVTEVFGVSIYEPKGAKIGDGSATGTITDSD